MTAILDLLLFVVAVGVALPLAFHVVAEWMRS